TKNRINAFAQLGSFLMLPDEGLEQLIESAPHQNAWFTPENTRKAITTIGKMLNQEDLERWMETTENSGAVKESKSVGLVLAGNIPLVGFHDILCVLASGNKALIKLSSQDQKLIPFILNKLVEIEPGFRNKFQFIERLTDFDAVIATGSGNTSRYFEYYFKNVPHIIRKNRNSIAVLSGTETEAELQALGHDIFDYFGLGCRNVSKLYVPADYDFKEFFEAIEEFKPVADHHKYNNNYDYNKSIFLVNLDKHLDNGFLLLKNDERIASPLAVLYHEEYMSRVQLPQLLAPLTDKVQCLVSHTKLPVDMAQVAFGETQQPLLWDYADRVDTMAFLNKL
ncbi:MAG TPA: acyl-CoA reductase, partial [Daejeonella sp.]|nr:acyl-CoA reductase [Daejeonella sp.]